jgi:signal transduction histidine kinase
VAVAVEDHGMGIAARDLRKLGTKFFRTSNAEKSGIAGTGIGLSIVQEIVRHHGGKLEVRSAEGAGSCFTMVIPASELGVER